MSDRQGIVVRIGRGDITRAEALLELAGAESVSLRDAADVPLLEPEPGSTPLWPNIEITALFDSTTDVDGVAAWLGDALGEAATVRVAVAEPGANGDAPTDTSAPFAIGRRLLIVPADVAADPGSRVGVRLRMGLAFGTGTHPTTRMCLEWLDAELQPGARVVDYGCGSGVLAVAALALGAAEVRAVDIEPQALEATADNAELNGIASRLSVSRPDALEDGDYDIVLANILSIPLIGLAGTFSRLLTPGGRVVLTGILDPQADGVISAYAPSFDIVEHRSSEGWSLLTARLKPSATDTRYAHRG